MNFIPLHALEICATIAGLLNVYLAARANIWNFFFGVITVSLYLVIFCFVKLYADMCLQGIFLLLQFYGCYQWLYGGEKHSVLLVHYITKKTLFHSVVTTVLLFLTIAFFLKNYTDSTTVVMDAIIVALSLVAQWMMSKKLIENWLVWILVNCLSIGLYFTKGLYLTSILYAIFLAICVWGYTTWRSGVNKVT